VNSDCRLLLLLGSCLSLLLILDRLLAISEFLADFFVGSNILSHPWVADDVYQVQALVRAVLQHIGDQVLELFSEEALSVRLAVVLPEKICAVGHD